MTSITIYGTNRIKQYSIIILQYYKLSYIFALGQYEFLTENPIICLSLHLQFFLKSILSLVNRYHWCHFTCSYSCDSSQIPLILPWTIYKTNAFGHYSICLARRLNWYGLDCIGFHQHWYNWYKHQAKKWNISSQVNQNAMQNVKFNCYRKPFTAFVLYDKYW